MTPPPSPWYLAATEALKSGPLPLDVLLATVARAVPPERALRERERIVRNDRAGHRARNKVDPSREYPRDAFIPLEVKLGTGARAVARAGIVSGVRSGKIVLYEKDGERWARAWNAKEQRAKKERVDAVYREARRKAVETVRRRYSPSAIAKKGWDTRRQHEKEATR